MAGVRPPEEVQSGCVVVNGAADAEPRERGVEPCLGRKLLRVLYLLKVTNPVLWNAVRACAVTE